jgi:hypothetical protein
MIQVGGYSARRFSGGVLRENSTHKGLVLFDGSSAPDEISRFVQFTHNRIAIGKTTCREPIRNPPPLAPTNLRSEIFEK